MDFILQTPNRAMLLYPLGTSIPRLPGFAPPHLKPPSAAYGLITSRYTLLVNNCMVYIHGH